MSQSVKTSFLMLVISFILVGCASERANFETSVIGSSHDHINDAIDLAYQDLLKKGTVPAVIIENKKLPPGIKAEAFTYVIQKGYQHKFLGTIDSGDFSNNEEFIRNISLRAAAAGGDFVFYPPVGDEKNLLLYGERAWVFKLDPKVKKTLKK